MKELRVQVKGLTEKDVRRWRRHREASAISSGVMLSGIGLVALLSITDGFHADAIVNAFRVAGDIGSLTGDCSGTIRALPSGHIGERQDVTITIKPPFHQIITRVTTNNPRCRTCDAQPKSPGEFVFSGTIRGTAGGKYRIEFLAYDKEGRMRCRGETQELLILAAGP
jgi:hypothetical protein